MSFLARFFGRGKVEDDRENKTSNEKDPRIGPTDECPYCKKKLNVIPSKKKKCENCGNYIYVRTRPEDRKKVLVTEEEKDRIELQWQQYNQDKENSELLQNPDFSSAKRELEGQSSKNPSISDIKERVYSQRETVYSSNESWGQYRSNKLDLAKLFIEKGDHNRAASALFEICYLDLNRSSNRMGLGTENSCLAPGILTMLEDELRELNLNEEDIRGLFTDFSHQTKVGRMTISPEDAWTKLSIQLQKSQRLQQINPKDVTNIFKEINGLIEKKSYNDAAQLIQKIKSGFYAKRGEYPNIIEIKKYLPALLESDQPQIRKGSQSLLLLIAKKDYSSISDIFEKHVRQLDTDSETCSESNIIGELASINLDLVKPFIPRLIKNLSQHPEWNVRRFSAFNLGIIGSNYPDLVRDSIPIMIEYIRAPYEVTETKPITIKAKEYALSLDLSAEKMLGVDQTQWLKDAYIDSLGMIAKGDPGLILNYKPLFEEIAQKDKSEYSRKKAQKVLDAFT